MKTNLLKAYLVAFFLVSDFVMFADDTTPVDDQEGGLEGGDDTPINGKLFILAILGISFAIYYFTNKRKEQLS